MSKLAFEAKRKFIHLFGLFYVGIYWVALRFLGKQIALLILLAALIGFISVEFFRINQKMKIPVFHVFWRPREENSLGGQVYYILGVILALALFDFKIALAVILMTVFGDMAAAIFGIAFGKHWMKNLQDTAWEGCIAEFIVDLIIGFIIIGNPLIVIPMALMATVVETAFPHIDDNLAIPVFAGFVGQGMSFLL
jgi:phytol kinase